MTYYASLEIPAWPAEQPSNVLTYSPSLAISRREDRILHPLILIERWIHDLPHEDRWMVRLFPPDARSLRHSWSDPSSGRDDPKFRPPLRAWHRYDNGETERFPRDSCQDAITKATELLIELTDRQTTKSVVRAIDCLKVPFEEAARSFTMKFRPPKPKPRPSTF